MLGERAQTCDSSSTYGSYDPQVVSSSDGICQSIRAQSVTSLGIIARSRMGEVIIASGKNIAYSLDPLVGEALVMKHGLEIAGRAGLEKVIIESDCKQPVDMLNSGAGDLSLAGSIVDDCVEYMRSLTCP
ncbi:hypothetical protein Droror1_Dr00003055 [Drosera rotundifolia]